MNIIIDAGNTAVKLAIFIEDELVAKEIGTIDNFESIIKQWLQDKGGISKAILSSVTHFEDSKITGLLPNLDVFKLNHNSRFPFINCYKTPETLGIDRLALVSAAFSAHPNKNVLIIDCGTCVTYDFINIHNEYLGGAISPGLRLRYKSLNNFTANLPLVDTEVPENFIGNSTVQSIHTGVVNGLVNEIDGTIDRYKRQYSDLTVILTGGDCKFLSNQLKNGIFANSNFLLQGLNFILEHNTNS